MELKMIDLFAEVDAAQVPIRDASGICVQRIQALTLSKLPARQKKHTISRVFLAAAIAATLAVSALAYAGFMTYKNPEQMLQDAYGDAQLDSLVDATGPYGPVPDIQRVPVSQAAVEQAAPYVASVERTVKDGNLSLTVHGHLYDSVTGCGVIYYTLENTEDIPYYLQYDGSIDGIPVMIRNSHGYSYLLKEKSTDRKLEIAYYYIWGDYENDNYIEMGVGYPGETISQEKEFERSQNTIRLPLNDGGGMQGLIGGGVRISPIGLKLETEDMDILKESGDSTTDAIKTLAVRFQDGSEYVIEDENTQNCVFKAVSENLDQMNVPFNRMIDVNEVQAVLVNGREITELQPITDGDRLRTEEFLEEKQKLDTAASAPEDRITYRGISLIPGTMEYDSATHTGWFICRVETEDHVDKLMQKDYFDTYAAGLRLNQLGQWQVLNKDKKSLDLRFSFVGLEKESPYLKFWFEGSSADPRLNQSTENLICLPFEKENHNALELADGSIIISDLGMFIDYKALDIVQESRPKNLSITFGDGSSLVISDWDEDILEGFWFNSRDLPEGTEKGLRVSFSQPIEAEKVKSVTYAGHTFEK